MKKSTKTTLVVTGAAAGVAGVLAILLWPRDSWADTNGEGANGDADDDADGRVVYRASDTFCFRDGQPFNAAQLGAPEQVVAALNQLGTAIGLAELLQSDARASTPVWPASEGYSPATSNKLKQFQAVARSLDLPGHEGAPASAVDGVFGECTARSITAALELQRFGQWPYEPVAALSKAVLSP